jgi:capsular polysaccharide export protein
MRIFSAAENPFIGKAVPVAAAAALPPLGLGRVPLSSAALAALFPDFAIERDRRASDVAAIAAWAGSPGLARRQTRARALGVPFLVLGAGLLRAAPRAEIGAPCLSALALDIAGPPSPVDSISPARVLARRGWETPRLLARARAGRQSLIEARLGGAWWHAGAGNAPPPGGAHILVMLDEPAVADMDGAPDEGLRGAMIDAALAENPPQEIVIAAAGLRPGARLQARLAAAAARGAAVITEPLDPWAALDSAERVYSAGGEIGFLALLAGRPVRCFAPAFYTGWGVTEDDSAVPQRPFRRCVDEVFAGGCLVATRYLDPFGNMAASFEDTLALLTEWRRIDEPNRRIAACVGMSFWKRRRVAEFVGSSAGTPVFRRSARGAVAAARGAPGAPPRAIAAWASRIPAGLTEAAARDGIPLIRVEDGFVRSVGLGADFLPPASLVFDSGGMYYDPRTRSDLETLLRETEFSPTLVERAQRLIAQLVVRGITKYNLASSLPAIEMPTGVRHILVPGQVEDDLSVLHGGGEIRSNLDLLSEVRRANPDAFILYKPHPDVAAGHRKGAVPDTVARRFADALVEGVSTATLLDRIEELHTMTSLAGFEALLRRRRVVVYGRPFYAGWGLTEDRLPIDRGRLLSLEEMVAGVLILYPRYLDPLTRLPCGPEVIIERLQRPELWRPGALVLARRLQGALARRSREIRARLR